MGCIDKAGHSHIIGNTFTDPEDQCSLCTCVADDVISCKKKHCAAALPKLCSSGNQPVLVTSADGCCEEYSCDCKFL